MPDAIVVGAGPNGLAGAIVLARAGLDVTVLEAAGEVGGGLRSGERTLPGLLHDHCAAVHPTAAGSPFLTGLGLDRYGLRWRRAEIDCAHPFADGRVATLHRSVEETAARLGPDGPRWRALFAGNFPELAQDILLPIAHVPRHPLRLAGFGALAALPATVLARSLRTDAARALFGGVAAHAFQPLRRPFTSAIALGLIAPAHDVGWPVAEGGSASIAAALAALLTDLGGTIETGVRVDAAGLPPAAVTLLDVAPEQAASILGDRLPARVARAYRRFRRGPAAFKVDFAVDGGVPWRHPDTGRAGTVHLGGSFAETVASGQEVAAGRLPERPFVLVGQQYLADPSRSADDVHPLYAYAQVPRGYPGDATAAIVDRIEQFAPGFRDRILAVAPQSPAAIAGDNPNFAGGDILTGAKTAGQLLLGPRGIGNPYSTGIPGVYLCSAATPPGPGAHGMCGANAAERALRDLGATR